MSVLTKNDFSNQRPTGKVEIGNKLPYNNNVLKNGSRSDPVAKQASERKVQTPKGKVIRTIGSSGVTPERDRATETSLPVLHRKGETRQPSLEQL